MAQRFRDYFSGASKPYYLTAAPQCPFPDAYLGRYALTPSNRSLPCSFCAQASSIKLASTLSTFNSVSRPSIALDNVFSTEHSTIDNNNCEVSGDFNFNTWDNWAKTQSPNSNVKIYMGVPASSTAANDGYVSIGQLTPIIPQTKSQFSSFGGVMMWDASEAYSACIWSTAIGVCSRACC